MGSPAAGAPSGVAKVTSTPAPRNTDQLTATSEGSKSSFGSGIRTRVVPYFLAASALSASSVLSTCFAGSRLVYA